MADKLISSLTAASALAAADLFVIEQGGNSRKATGTQVGALSRLMDVIETKTFDGTVGTYTFSGIPATYTHLELILTGRSTQVATATTVSLQVNGLSTGIYDRQSHFANNTTAGAGEVLSGTSMSLIDLAAANAVANQPGFLRINFWHYAQTTFWKVVEFHGRQANSTSTGTSYTISGDGQVRTTNAISSVTITLASGNFVSGSIATLRGV